LTAARLRLRWRLSSTYFATDDARIIKLNNARNDERNKSGNNSRYSDGFRLR